MLRLAEQRDQFGQRHGFVHRDDLGARHHHVARPSVRRSASRLASITRSCADRAGRLAFAFLDHLFQAFAHGGAGGILAARASAIRRLSRDGRSAASLMPPPCKDRRCPAACRIFTSSGSITLASRGAFMIVAGQMQHAMHHQMGGMVGEASCRPLWLPGWSRHRRWRCRRDNRLRWRGGKGQHIGRLVLAAKIAVEGCSLRVAAPAAW